MMTIAPEPPVTVTVRNVGSAGPLLALFESLMPIRFAIESAAPGQEDRMLLCATRADPHDSSGPASTTLAIFNPACRSAGRSRLSAYRDEREVPFPFNGKALSGTSSYASSPLRPGVGETILATTDGSPTWTVLHDGPSRHFRSALPLPDVAADTSFFDFFNGACFTDALPLVDFLRQVSGESRFAPAQLRASFVIDDPNLHWPRYGFVDYRRVIAHARSGNYHVSFATIPLDTWYTHKGTAELFRSAPDRVSLLVHGNNHARAELAVRYSNVERHALLRQSMQRMERLSLRDGLRFSRVMVPPHGACGHDMLHSLPLCGFEAACISSGSLRGHNPRRAWTRTLGYWPSETIAGCPVLPRWGLRGAVANTILLAAYLGQAIVIMGHHQDLAGEMAELDRVAAMINALGEVTWGDMTTLSRLNYVARREGAQLHVRAHGAVIRLPEAAGAETLMFEPLQGASARSRMAFPGQAGGDIETPLRPADRLPAFAMAPVSVARTHGASGAGLSLPLLARRLLTEARDRITPYGRRIAAQPRALPEGP